MLLTSTNTLEENKIKHYLRYVSGEALVKSKFHTIVNQTEGNVIAGRAEELEGMLQKARDIAIKEMIQEAELYEANAIVGVNLDYECIGDMMMVMVNGTAVFVE